MHVVKISMEEYTFADLLRQYRAREKISQAELVQKLEAKISLRTIKHWEKGDYLPRYRQDILLLAEALLLSRAEVNRLLVSAKQEREYELEEDISSPFVLRPLQIPSRAEHFTGREAELVQLMIALKPGLVLAVCGTGGIGKTALVAELIYRLNESGELVKRFPDGLIFYSFYGRPSTELALEHVVKSYYVQARDYSPNTVRRILGGKDALIVFDGTEDAASFNEVLDAVSGSCCVLITSRKRSDARMQRQDLGPLEPEKALDLLRSWSPNEIDNEIAAMQICQWIGYLPLAIRLIGHYLKSTGELTSEYFDWLEKKTLRILKNDEIKEDKDSLFQLIERNLQQVGDVARPIMSLIGLLALAPFEKEVIEEVLQGGPIRQSLNMLVDYGILQRLSNRNYLVIHALIHTYAHTFLTSTDEILTASADYFTVRVKQKGYQSSEGTSEHIVSLLTKLKDRNFWKTATTLAQGSDDYLSLQGHWAYLRVAREIGVTAFVELGDKYNAGVFLNKLGIIYRDLGLVESSVGCYQKALINAREIDDDQLIIDTYANLGVSYRELGQIKSAMDCHFQALDILSNTPYPRGEVRNLIGIGLAYFALGEHTTAIEHYERALSIAHDIEDTLNEANVLNNLGQVYLEKGSLEEAANYFEQSLILSQKLSHLSGQANSFGNLAIVMRQMGKTEEAIKLHERALDISRELNYARTLGEQFNGLGICFSILKQFELARDYFARANDIAIKIGNLGFQGTCLINLGSIYHELGQLEAAIRYLELAFDIFQNVGTESGMSLSSFSIACIYNELKNKDQAKKYLVIAMPYLSKVNTPYSKQAQELLLSLENDPG